MQQQPHAASVSIPERSNAEPIAACECKLSLEHNSMAGFGSSDHARKVAGGEGCGWNNAIDGGRSFRQPIAFGTSCFCFRCYQITDASVRLLEELAHHSENRWNKQWHMCGRWGLISAWAA